MAAKALNITLTSQWPWWRLKSPAPRLFTQPFIQTQIKENIKAPPHWPLCGEFTGTGEFPAQRVSYAENVPIWWRHHDLYICRSCGKTTILNQVRDPWEKSKFSFAKYNANLSCWSPTIPSQFNVCPVIPWFPARQRQHIWYRVRDFQGELGQYLRRQAISDRYVK